MFFRTCLAALAAASIGPRALAEGSAVASPATTSVRAPEDLCRAEAVRYRPEDGRSPLTLLAGPVDGKAYRDEAVRAQGLMARRDYAAAEPALTRLVEVYPRDPETWLALATARRKLGRHAQAASAYEQAGCLIGWGPWPDTIGFWAAASHLAAGHRAAALAQVRRDVEGPSRVVYRWRYFEAPEFAALREDREFRAILGYPDPTPWSRDEGWRQDIDYLYAEVARVHPDYRDRPLPPAFTQAYQALRARVGAASDPEILVGLNRMLATLNPYGHTELWNLSDPACRIRDRQLPVRFYAFADGLYIVNATAEHRDLVGARVLSIGDPPAEEALRLASTAVSRDGYLEYVWRAPNHLGSAVVLQGLGLTRSAEQVAIRVQRPGAAPETVTLPTLSASPWRAVPPAAPGLAPILFDAAVDYHWLREEPQYGARYVQLNNILDDKDETLAAFGVRLRTVLQETRATSLILDVRRNGGGSSGKDLELLRTLVAFSTAPGRQLYVITGRQTYSAAGMLISDLERLADPVFVGEAASHCCNLHGDASSFTLPFSRISGSVSGTRQWRSAPWDERVELSPSVPVVMTSADYFAGRDPALETVRRLIDAAGASSP